MGIRSVVSLAPSAYLASAASTVDLTTSLLPTRLHDAVDNGIATAMSAWIRLATCSTAPSIALFPPASPVQHAWDNRCCEVQADLLLDAAANHIERARLLASRAPGPGDWLGALLLPGSGLKMDTLPSALQSVCVLVPRSFVHINVTVYVGHWSKLMDTMACPAATALDAIHDTTK